MKKRYVKIFGAICSAALLLTGCATVSNVSNSSSEMIYTGGSTVTVENYTYFANAYTPYSSSTDSTDFDYKGQAKISYLARINNDSFDAPNGKDFSPNNVEKVSKNKKEKITGFQNQDMFVLGNYIYYTSMNTHQDDNLQNNYSLVTLWRSKLNGDSVQEIFTTEYFSSSGKFAPVGDKEDGYFWVCFTGEYSDSTELSKKYSGQIISIPLGNKKGKAKAIANNVSSAAFADVNNIGSSKSICYTTTTKIDDATKYSTYMMGYNGSGVIKFGTDGENITFVDMIRNKTFYYTSETKYASKTLIRDIEGAQEGETLGNYKQKVFEHSKVSDIHLIAEGKATEGYVYKGSSSLMYVSQDGNVSKLLATSAEFQNILFIDDERVYISNSDTIARVAILPNPGEEEIKVEVLARMTVDGVGIIESGQYGFDGQYVYFFAKLNSNVETEETFDEADSNKYMYRVEKNSVIKDESDMGNYQLISKTKENRTPKVEDEE